MIDLPLFKEKSELFALRIKENNLLERDVIISHRRKRNLDLAAASTIEGLLCYCRNINDLFQKLVKHTLSMSGSFSSTLQKEV